MRLDLHQDVHVFAQLAVKSAHRIGEEARGAITARDGGVIAISRQHIVGMRGEGVTNHAEQAVVLGFTVQGPARVENLVAAMLGIGLREHHEFDIGRVARERGEAHHQIIDLVFGERETQRAIRLHQRRATLASERHVAQGTWRCVALQACEFGIAAKHGFGHAVVEQRQQACALLITHVCTMPGRDAFDACQRCAAVARDVGGFA